MKFHRRRAKLGFVAFETLIDVDSLQNLLAARTQVAPMQAAPTQTPPGLAIIDCRFDLKDPEAGRRAYLEAHIPGAWYADLNRDLSGPIDSNSGRHPLPAPAAFAARLGHLGVGNDTQAVAYDDGEGSIPARLWWMLRWLGHSSVAVLDGGFKAWTARGGALQSGETLPAV